MPRDERMHRMKTMVWGWFLIAIGAAFLLDRYGFIHLPNVGQLWPLIFVVIAAIHVVERRYGSAVMFVVFAAWFQACTLEWHGITYHNSWPALVIAVGLGIVIRALTGEDERMRERFAERMQRRAERLRNRADRLREKAERWREESGHES